MSWLRRAVRRWLEGPMQEASSMGIRGHTDVLQIMSSSENPKTLTVTPIRNGFLVMGRRYNPSGPDSVDATFAATVEDLTTVLIADLVAARIKN